MIFKQRLKNRITSCGFVVGLVFSLQAQGAANITDAELAVLPPYCAAKMRTHDPVATQSWESQFGHENWIHIHHYCDALVEVNRAQHSNAYERKRSLDNATGQFDYVLKNTRPDFFMQPDFHYGKGRALQLQNAEGAAIAEFQRAVEIRADFVPALIELVKFYKRTGKHDMALSVLRRGLEKSPAAVSLRKRYKELGGDLSEFPEHAPTPSDQSDKAADKTTTSAAPNGLTEPAPQPTGNNVEPTKIGSPENPWCRFCPDPAPAGNQR